MHGAKIKMKIKKTMEQSSDSNVRANKSKNGSL
jgi:hypothetical protein